MEKIKNIVKILEGVLKKYSIEEIEEATRVIAFAKVYGEIEGGEVLKEVRKLVKEEGLEEVQNGVRLYKAYQEKEEYLECKKINVKQKYPLEFDEQQAVVLKYCTEGIDISRVAKIEYTAPQMLELIKGLEKGIELEKYIDKNYDEKQIHEILRGVENRVDISKYAKEEYPAPLMKRIRWELEGRDMRKFIVGLSSIERRADEMYKSLKKNK